MLQCHKEYTGKQQIYLEDFDYTEKGEFSIGFWFRNPTSDGALFEYILSHGTIDAEKSYFGPNNVHVYIPEDDHPANGILRTIVNDNNEGYDFDYYVDTDGQITNNGARNVDGHINIDDDLWHMYTLVTDANGFKVYLDGRFAGKGSHGGDDIDPAGPVQICTRSDLEKDRNFGGYVTQFSFFSNALTTKEVWGLYVQQQSALTSFSPPPPPSGSCEDNFYHTDCDGNCFGGIFLQWVSDGICDDGTTYGINLKCEAYQNDGDDCLTTKTYTAKTPYVYFPLNEGSGDQLYSDNEEFTGDLEGPEWAFDYVMESYVLQCEKAEKDFAQLFDIDYYGGAGFAINFWMNNPSSEGFLFEYLVSHGANIDDLSQNEMHVYLPEKDHPAYGVVRTIIKDADDPADTYYVDSDGQVSPKAKKK